MSRSAAHPARLAIVAAAFVASASCWAVDGEAFGYDMPSGRHTAPAAVMTPDEARLAAASTYAADRFGMAPTRAQVREQLLAARAAGTMSLHGEAGDTEAVLRARDVANAEIEHAILAEYTAEQQRRVAFAEAEARRADIEQEGLLASSFGLGDGEVLVEAAGFSVEGGEADVSVDVIDVSPTGGDAIERLIVSIDGDAAADPEAQALHLRRHLGAMGLPQRKIYIEAKQPD